MTAAKQVAPTAMCVRLCAPKTACELSADSSRRLETEVMQVATANAVVRAREGSE